MKTYLLDTSVLLYDPSCLTQFEDNTIILPLMVLEELDRFKDGERVVHRNAREIIRQLEEFRCSGDILKGVDLPGGGRLLVVNDDEHRNGGDADDVIIRAAKSSRATIVTKDVNMRIRAGAHGVGAEDYEADQTDLRVVERDTHEVSLTEANIDHLFAGQGLADEFKDLQVNQYAVGRSVSNQRHTVLLRRHPDHLLYDASIEKQVYSIHPRNREQHFALDALMDPRLSLVVLSGKAGTGKTLMALAAGLEQVVNRELYEKMVVARPVVPMGRDLGYLPGDVSEKLAAWMKPIEDNLDFLTRGGRSGDTRRGGIEDLQMFKYVEVEPLTYIRGRSLPNQFLVIDEAQNLTPHEVKTIITRAGEGTKVVLTGDPEQIDNAFLNRYSNALSYVENKMMGHHLFASVRLVKGERSELAEVAAQLL